MKDIPATWREQIDRPHGGSAFAVCLRIPLVYSSAVNLNAALTSARSEIVIAPYTYRPFQFSLSAMSESSTLDFAAVTLSISNTSRQLTRYLEQGVTGGGIVGKKITAVFVLLSDLTQAEYITWTVRSAIVGDEAINLDLGTLNFSDVVLPSDRYRSKDCRLGFGSNRCGYVRNSSAAFTYCPKIVSACSDRGDDMVSRGLPRLQPQRFGGFLGIAN